MGAAGLGVSLDSEPGSRRFYVLTSGVAANWVAAGLAAGPVPWRGRERDPVRRVVVPVAMGVGAFAVFCGCALVAQRIPILRRAVSGVLRYAHRGHAPLVLATVLANGAAEEIFFRGAVFDATAGRPIAGSTAVYALVTAGTGNPALVLASVLMGALFGWQRRTTGGIEAPVLTHLTWSTLMVSVLPGIVR